MTCYPVLKAWAPAPGFRLPVASWAPQKRHSSRVLCVFQLGCRVGVPCEPDLRDRVSLDQFIHRAREFVTSSFPGLEPEPAIVETCMYTVRPRVQPTNYPAM